MNYKTKWMSSCAESKGVYLVVSTNFMGGDGSKQKRPGVRLAKRLRDNGIFCLIDLHSNYNGFSIKEALTLMGKDLRQLMSIVEQSKAVCGRAEVFFYNFPLLYVLYYFVCRMQAVKVSLLMADGENCVLLKKHPDVFASLFDRYVYLAKDFESIGCVRKKEKYWFPGFVSSSNVRKCYVGQLSRVLYNSSLKRCNGPKDLIEIAVRNKWMRIDCTCSEEDYRREVGDSVDMPENMFFHGELGYDEYLCLLRKVDAVLLVRDNRFFENRYNFPSKLLECFEFGVPCVSIYEIKGVPGDMYYCTMGSFEFVQKKNTEAVYADHEKISWSSGSFLGQCNPVALKEWVSGGVDNR